MRIDMTSSKALIKDLLRVAVQTAVQTAVQCYIQSLQSNQSETPTQANAVNLQKISDTPENPTTQLAKLESPANIVTEVADTANVAELTQSAAGLAAL